MQKLHSQRIGSVSDREDLYADEFGWLVVRPKPRRKRVPRHQFLNHTTRPLITHTYQTRHRQAMSELATALTQAQFFSRLQRRFRERSARRRGASSSGYDRSRTNSGVVRGSVSPRDTEQAKAPHRKERKEEEMPLPDSKSTRTRTRSRGKNSTTSSRTQGRKEKKKEEMPEEMPLPDMDHSGPDMSDSKNTRTRSKGKVAAPQNTAEGAKSGRRLLVRRAPKSGATKKKQTTESNSSTRSLRRNRRANSSDSHCPEQKQEQEPSSAASDNAVVEKKNPSTRRRTRASSQPASDRVLRNRSPTHSDPISNKDTVECKSGSKRSRQKKAQESECQPHGEEQAQVASPAKVQQRPKKQRERQQATRRSKRLRGRSFSPASTPQSASRSRSRRPKAAHDGDQVSEHEDEILDLAQACHAESPSMGETDSLTSSSSLPCDLHSDSLSCTVSSPVLNTTASMSPPEQQDNEQEVNVCENSSTSSPSGKLSRPRRWLASAIHLLAQYRNRTSPSPSCVEQHSATSGSSEDQTESEMCESATETMHHRQQEQEQEEDGNDEPPSQEQEQNENEYESEQVQEHHPEQESPSHDEQQSDVSTSPNCDSQTPAQKPPSMAGRLLAAFTSAISSPRLLVRSPFDAVATENSGNGTCENASACQQHEENDADDEVKDEHCCVDDGCSALNYPEQESKQACNSNADLSEADTEHMDQNDCAVSETEDQEINVQQANAFNDDSGEDAEMIQQEEEEEEADQDKEGEQQQQQPEQEQDQTGSHKRSESLASRLKSTASGWLHAVERQLMGFKSRPTSSNDSSPQPDNSQSEMQQMYETEHSGEEETDAKLQNEPNDQNDQNEHHEAFDWNELEDLHPRALHESSSYDQDMEANQMAQQEAPDSSSLVQDNDHCESPATSRPSSLLAKASSLSSPLYSWLWPAFSSASVPAPDQQSVQDQDPPTPLDTLSFEADAESALAPVEENVQEQTHHGVQDPEQQPSQESSSLPPTTRWISALGRTLSQVMVAIGDAASPRHATNEPEFNQDEMEEEEKEEKEEKDTETAPIEADGRQRHKRKEKPEEEASDPCSAPLSNSSETKQHVGTSSTSSRNNNNKKKSKKRRLLSSDGLVVRMAKPEDADFVLSGRRATLWHGEKVRMSLTQSHQELKLINEAIDAGSVMVASELNQANRLAAFVWFEIAADAPFGMRFDRFRSRYMRVYSMYIAPQWRNKGVGKVLYAAIEEHARNRRISSIWLDVLESNENTKQFHEKLGFQSMVSFCCKHLDTNKSRATRSSSSSSSSSTAGMPNPLTTMGPFTG